MVEFAIITPLLLLLIAGIADFGFLFQSFEVTTNAAREGARVAILPGYDVNTYAAPRARVADYITSANLKGSYTTNIVPETFDLGGGVTVEGVRVTVTYVHPMWIIGPIVGMINQTFQPTITYTTVARMRTEMQAGATP
ncbi:MAG TPA: TadE family protein [Vicinamibacterales bacterium]|nr:TadE family protein [Vicinamibacterales bacterium]